MKIASQGFTLIEVMVALAVIAVGISSVMLAVSNFGLNAGRVENRMIAQWLAANRLVEYQLKAYDGTLKTANSSSFSQTMSGREWFIKETVADIFESHGKKVTAKICLDQAYSQCVGDYIFDVSYRELSLK